MLTISKTRINKTHKVLNSENVRDRTSAKTQRKHAKVLINENVRDRTSAKTQRFTHKVLTMSKT